ncbi:16S rRNA (cytosine(967)-C(5))-methyltransferase RsmB [Rubrivirga marina]|uniref:16S rRNA (cytosine(967)-C(5))-methyltransferase n=1 Tax=Rubrivirga marina TaxID=1196024 RepID=A0A271J3S6_9BACT|nr:16S rRNA (cytosine(967)-C(5))-methyltransferase RsmB [Rubrivirga marina]PAP77359.1 16S rRNA (cytosine(967)-C(5))-methyltransferase [Rubrivirga marina]
MADPTARVLAVQRLLRVEAEGAHVARLADGAHPPDVSRRAVDYVSGVTRQKRWLDFLIAEFYRGDVEGLDPELRQILRIGTYELIEREVAPHAAVNEAVETAKALLHRGAAGLTNGVLRALDRAHRAGALPDPDTGDLANDLAVRYSHPTWPVRRWLDRWGEEATRAFLAASNEPGHFTLRVTGGAEAVPGVIRELADLGVEAEPSEWTDDFLAVDRLQPILRSGLLDEGTVAVQDVAAGLVVHVLDPQPEERILDAAAAPGGKAVYAALRMHDRGEVAALDVSEAKVGLIAGAARRHGLSIVRPVKADLTTWESDARFDRVLLDAPCSGSGVLAKRADLRWRRSPEGLDELAELQDALLDAAARHVRPGGLLVYSTCSVEAEENDDRVAAFLSRRNEFRLESVEGLVPDALVDDVLYRALPHVHGTDGAFAARLRRSPD